MEQMTHRTGSAASTQTGDAKERRCTVAADRHIASSIASTRNFSRPVSRLMAGFALCCAAFTATAATTAEPAEQRVVTVPGTKDPEMRNYRTIAEALDEFDEHRRLAPSAPLQFRFFHASNGTPAGDADGLSLRLASDDVSIPIPIDANGRFVIMRNQAAYDSDAAFILNRKQGLFTYRPDIRTPGLPDNVRRLGDLRLECYVLSGVAKEKLPFWVRAMITTALRTTDWCGKEKASVGGYPAYGKLAKVTVREGDRHEELNFEGSSYMVPIGPGKWSDDALIELEYATEEAEAPAATTTATATAP
jgi:hypothetical protein